MRFLVYLLFLIIFVVSVNSVNAIPLLDSQTDDYDLGLIVYDNASSSRNGGSVSPDETIYPVPWETRPPLKQFRDGIDPKVIHCNDELILIQKYNGMPACVKYDTAVKLTGRGWTQTFWIGASGEEVK